jgi:hypothetical protein
MDMCIMLGKHPCFYQMSLPQSLEMLPPCHPCLPRPCAALPVPAAAAAVRYPGEGCMSAGAGQQQQEVWVPGELVVVAPSLGVPALQGASLGLRWGVAGGKQYMSLLNKLHLAQLV